MVSRQQMCYNGTCQEDRDRYFAGRRIDEEALAHIRQMQEEAADPVKYPVADA